MTRRYGRAPRGERLVDAVPHGHWKTTTFVAALRADGLTAPMVIGTAHEAFTPDECGNYIRHAGYTATH